MPTNQNENLTEKEVAEFYDDVYYRTETVHSIRPLSHYREVFGLFGRVEKGLRCLDVGCGTGWFLKAAQEAGLQVYGVDISQKAVEISQKNVPEATLMRSAGESLPFLDKFFDYIIYGGTLEHFLDVDKGLEEAVRVTKDYAHFMIIVPNKDYWLWRIRGNSGTHQSEIKELLLDRAGWEKIFREHSIVPLQVYHDPWPWQSVKIFKFKNPWKIIRRAIYRFLWLFIPLKWTYQFVFICEKNKE